MNTSANVDEVGLHWGVGRHVAHSYRLHEPLSLVDDARQLHSQQVEAFRSAVLDDLGETGVDAREQQIKLPQGLPVRLSYPREENARAEIRSVPGDLDESFVLKPPRSPTARRPDAA